MARKLALIASGPTLGPWLHATGYESLCEVIGAEVTIECTSASGASSTALSCGLSPMPSGIAKYRFHASAPSSVYIHLA